MMVAGREGRRGRCGPCPYPHGRRLAAPREAACGCGDGIGQGSLSLALFRRAALNLRGVGTARAPSWGEPSQGAAVCARGGTPPRWWALRAFPGVSACRLPGRLRDVLGPRLPVA